MKILHTADWHVGKTLHRRQRLDESARGARRGRRRSPRPSRSMLTLVCGDVFDQLRASAEAERIVYARCCRPPHDRQSRSLVIPGNHDNAQAASQRSSSSQAPQGSTSSPSPPPAGRRLVELQSRDGATGRAGSPRFHGCREGAVRRRGDDGPRGATPTRPTRRSCRRLLQRTLRRLRAGQGPPARRAPVRRVARGRRRRAGADDRATFRDRAPGTADDAAVHRARARAPAPSGAPARRCPARYAGSLLQLDFGEREQEQEVSSSTSSRESQRRSREVPLTRGRP